MKRSNKSRGTDSDAGAALAGVLVIDKPRGITSMRIVEIVRRKAGGVKTGHAGTLDPLATGVLVLALGSATKLIDRLMATKKRYRTTLDLAAFTATDDAEGPRVEVAPPDPLPTATDVREALARFTGAFLQKPPAFSAVKVQGRRAYKMARKGQPVEIDARPVTVHSIELLRYEWPTAELDIHCDKGFYVRSLAREVGEALGTGGFCASIRRTAVGPFALDEALALDDVPEPLTQDRLIAPEAAMEMVAARPG